MMLELRAEVALEVGAELGEGPVWDDRGATLLWTDIVSGTLHRFDPSSGTDTTIRFPSTLGSFGLCDDDALVLALGDRFATLARTDTVPRPVGDLRVDTAHACCRFNDGKVDPWGRFCAGTMDLSGGTGASLYCVDCERNVSVMLDDVGCSNGLDWSQDRSYLYYIDTATGAVDRFALDPCDGRLLERRRYREFPAGETPDGLCLDEDVCGSPCGARGKFAATTNAVSTGSLTSRHRGSPPSLSTVAISTSST